MHHDIVRLLEEYNLVQSPALPLYRPSLLAQHLPGHQTQPGRRQQQQHSQESTETGR